MRTMQPEDLGDPRLFEDEAIREQAARLQMNIGNLHGRLLQLATISGKTEYRISNLMLVTEEFATDAADFLKYKPL